MLKYNEQKGGQKAVNNKKKSSLINKYIFNHQFKENFKGLLIWSAIVAAILVLIVALYPLVEGMFDEMPEEMLVLITLPSIRQWKAHKCMCL